MSSWYSTHLFFIKRLCDWRVWVALYNKYKFKTFLDTQSSWCTELSGNPHGFVSINSFVYQEMSTACVSTVCGVVRLRSINILSIHVPRLTAGYEYVTTTFGATIVAWPAPSVIKVECTMTQTARTIACPQTFFEGNHQMQRNSWFNGSAPENGHQANGGVVSYRCHWQYGWFSHWFLRRHIRAREVYNAWGINPICVK